MKTCTHDDCARTSKKRGMCGTHYQAALRSQGSGRTRYTRTCAGCAQEFQSQRPDGKLCSDACRSVAYMGTERPEQRRVSPLPANHAVRLLIKQAIADEATVRAIAQRSPLRVALEGGHHADVIAAIRSHVTVNEVGCWIWQRTIKDGYPTIKVNGKTLQVHRLSLEAKHRAPLGKQAAHHACATTRCVNPEHLQPVTARENTAEMLARTYMESRIADLEAALAAHEPTHPLLHEIGVILAA